MRQAVLIKKEKIVIQEAKEDIIGEEEVLIQTKAVTICGSDIRYFRADSLPYHLKYPLVLGHEASGIILKTGRKVTNVREGDRVCIEPGIWCGKCKNCKKGVYNFCENLKFMASKGTPGALQEKIVWPSKCVFKLGAKLSYADGALVEPLSVVYSALENADPGSKQSVLVLGAGSLGFLAAVLLKKINPQIAITFVDLWEEKMEMGVKIGFKKSQFCIKNNDLKGTFDMVVDFVGSSKLLKRFYPNLMPGCDWILVGISDDVINIPFKDLINKGINIRSSYRYCNTYPKVLKFLEDGIENIDKIITHCFAFEDVQKAFLTAANSHEALKVLIEF